MDAAMGIINRINSAYRAFCNPKEFKSMIKEGYISKEEFFNQTKKFGADEAMLRRLAKAMGFKAEHCGAPAYGGYGYRKEAAIGINQLFKTRPAHIGANAWIEVLLKKSQLELRTMAGV